MKTNARKPSSARPKNELTVRDESALRQGLPCAGGRIHLLIGPVGAGKSTFGIELGRRHAALRLTLDEWMAVLFRADRPEHGVMDWYVARTRRCIDMIWSVAKNALCAGMDVVLEIGLIRRQERFDFYGKLAELSADCTIYVLDAERELRRARVETRNREQRETFSMIVPPAVFELASDLWEPPDLEECRGRDVRFMRTD